MMTQSPYPGRVLALDVGDKRIGIAMSDELQMTAQALYTLERSSQKKDMEKILSTVAEYDVKKIIVGLPISLSGKITPQTQKVLHFTEILKKNTTVPIESWDEALTTKQAEDTLIEADMSRKKRKKVIDKLAAVFILRSYLEENQ